jgi:glycerol kinase
VPANGALNRMLLAVDQGTSATKAVLVDAPARSSRAARAASARAPAPGWVEQSAEEIWAACRRRRACLAAGRRRGRRPSA